MASFKKYVPVFVTVTTFIISCKKYEHVQETKIGNDIQVPLHDCSAGETQPYICFDSILEDSRCPATGFCIWQGTAIVKVGFHENLQVHTFEMALQGYPGLGYPSDTTINGYTIIFKDLKPYPGSTGDDSQPQAIFNISH